MNNSQQKPIGRDHRGRLIYPGDMLIDIRNGQLVIAYKAEYGKNDEYRVYGFNDSGVLINGVLYDIYAEVDLNLSPERTNYERYFADKGTFDEIEDAFTFREPCGSEYCETCPFQAWGEWFGGGDSVGSCINFYDWLEEEATI